MKKLKLLLAPALLLAGNIAQAHSPGEHARVYFKNLQDGQTVTAPYKVQFGIEGYGIVPAGTRDKRRHTAGHHHLLVDHPGNLDMEEPLDHSKNCMHFDQGETEAVLDLPPGKHTLQLLLGDEDHEPTDPPLMSKKITITVQ
ncbi:MAG TPA: DUF4399 domain-containing protein [Thiolapillus brandeum]|uniref:DUF4399 domain-containing protein n=1 Tax=Thiolapillus brandeum TaxID=1076588 RepID=A0A831RYN8_9GAMM|nr:DUF4399 domain-containing protein [Thiolapillus brandeum]